MLPGVPLDTLDFTSYTMNLGSKMVLDAQSGRSAGAGRGAGAGVGAGTARAPMADVRDPRAFDERITAWRLAWGGLLVVQVKGAVGGGEAGWVADAPAPSSSLPGRQVVEALVRRPEYAGVPLIVAVSEDVEPADDAVLLWGIFTRFDCARDVIPARTESRGAWLECRGPLGIDATWKPGYPEPVGSAPEVIERVSGWWTAG
jgi:4-hydroxy-3-polyprenylbenzoate decarboxylase